MTLVILRGLTGYNKEKIQPKPCGFHSSKSGTGKSILI
jgi:hypothetical protein